LFDESVERAAAIFKRLRGAHLISVTAIAGL
jgi:hypothetical protein